MFVALQFVASYKFSGPDVGPGAGPALSSAATLRASLCNLAGKALRWRSDGGKSSSRLLNQRVTDSKPAWSFQPGRQETLDLIHLLALCL